MTEAYPPPARVRAACVAAVLVPLTLFWLALAVLQPETAFPMFLLVYGIGLVIALMHLLFLALPAYLILRRRWPLRWHWAALAGFLVAAIPSGLIALSATTGDYSAGGAILVEDGRQTAAGWLNLLVTQTGLGILGAAGGIAFWIVLAAGTTKGGPSPERACGFGSGAASRRFEKSVSDTDL